MPVRKEGIFSLRVPSCVTVCLQLMAQWFFIRIPQSISLTLVFIPFLALPFVIEWIYQRPKLIAKISTPNAALGEHNSNTTSRPVTCVMHMLCITKGRKGTKIVSSKAKISSGDCYFIFCLCVYLCFACPAIIYPCLLHSSQCLSLVHPVFVCVVNL